jgi:high-affinity iron transporter
MAKLVREPVTVLASDDRSRAIVAYFRTHPEALAESNVSLGLTRARLEDSWAAYGAGDARAAVNLAVSAYLDGFERIEPALDVIDRELRLQIEGGFLLYRESMRDGDPAHEVAPLYEALVAYVGRAERRLDDSGMTSYAAFVSALAIVAREGFEAVLLIVALCGMLLRAGRREALRFVHFGWIGALVAGGATWLAARHLIAISGAGRELIEGATSLVASAILFYVSYWLVAKVSSRRWQAFIERRVRGALSRGSLWTLTGIAFVAVYREVFETILFYEAVIANAGPEGLRSVLFGTAAGACLLLVLAYVAFRVGARLPVRRFFVASSALLYVLCVVLAGQGIAALQEAAIVPATPVSFVRIDWLGVYPTLEGLALQALLVAAAILAALWIAAALRAERTAAQAAASGPAPDRQATV